MKLYEITHEIESLASQVPDTPEDEALVTEAFQQLQLSLETKVEGVAKFIRNLETEEEATSAEITRLTERRSQIRRGLGWIRRYLKGNLERLGYVRVETPLFRVTVVKPRQRVVVKATNDVPQEFVTTVIETKVDKKAILDYVKRTGEIPSGVEIEEETSLQIR